MFCKAKHFQTVGIALDTNIDVETKNVYLYEELLKESSWLGTFITNWKQTITYNYSQYLIENKCLLRFTIEQRLTS